MLWKSNPITDSLSWTQRVIKERMPYIQERKRTGRSMATTGCFCFSRLAPAVCPDDSLLLMRLPHQVLCLIPSEPRGLGCYRLAGGSEPWPAPLSGSGPLPPYRPPYLPPASTQPLDLGVWVWGRQEVWGDKSSGGRQTAWGTGLCDLDVDWEKRVW